MTTKRLSVLDHQVDPNERTVLKYDIHIESKGPQPILFILTIMLNVDEYRHSDGYSVCGDSLQLRR